MRSALPKIAATATAVFLASAGAAEAGAGFGASAGTDGLGADAYVKFNPIVTARGGFRYADLSVSRTIDDIDYDLDVGFTAGLAALDIHPFANGFHISAGGYFSDRTIDYQATPAAPVQIGDMVFTPQEVGTVAGASDWNDAAPFLGLGFNNRSLVTGPVAFQAMIGVMYIGEPDVSLEATGGLLANDPTFLDELAQEEQNLADDFDDFPVYPIVSLGLTVKF